MFGIQEGEMIEVLEDGEDLLRIVIKRLAGAEFLPYRSLGNDANELPAVADASTYEYVLDQRPTCGLLYRLDACADPCWGEQCAAFWSRKNEFPPSV